MEESEHNSSGATYLEVLWEAGKGHPFKNSKQQKHSFLIHNIFCINVKLRFISRSEHSLRLKKFDIWLCSSYLCPGF